MRAVTSGGGGTPHLYVFRVVPVLDAFSEAPVRFGSRRCWSVHEMQV